MSDANEITGLVLSYARLLDGGDVDAVAALFEHSTWRSLPHGSVLSGTEEVRPVYEDLLDQVGTHPTKHLITNLSIDVEADATTALIGSRSRSDGPMPYTMAAQPEPPEIIWQDGVEYARVRKGHAPLSSAARRARYKAGKCDECGEPVGPGGAVGQDGRGNPVQICRSCNQTYRRMAGLESS